ncbi:hypothetical protein C8R44DRAFT_744903 [Mycena epipterygia]|nr:hypothetical protein C8R44DRAFT_744903 [Mycena epipterygia]
MPMDFDHDENSQVADDANAIPTVALPPRFILMKHHPHANKPNEIILLDRAQSVMPLSKDDSHPAPLPDARLWAPFNTYSNYKFTSRCVRRRTLNAEIDEDLRDQHAHALSSDCFITFRNHRDMEKSLVAARMTNIPFRRKTLRIDFEGVEFGGVYEVEIEFRDPWQILKQWVTDESLASMGPLICLIDCTTSHALGESGDDSLPTEDYPSCYLGLHVWLDKGLVSTKVKMHPILFRGCWINSATRNGSGNVGSALARFFKMVWPV